MSKQLLIYDDSEYHPEIADLVAIGWVVKVGEPDSTTLWCFTHHNQTFPFNNRWCVQGIGGNACKIGTAAIVRLDDE